MQAPKPIDAINDRVSRSCILPNNPRCAYRAKISMQDIISLPQEREADTFPLHGRSRCICSSVLSLIFLANSDTGHHVWNSEGDPRGEEEGRG